MLHTFLRASKYDVYFFRLPNLYVSDSVLFVHGALVLSFYIAVALTLYICRAVVRWAIMWQWKFTPFSQAIGSSLHSHLQLIEAEWRIYASVIKPSLVQIMACRLVGAKPLSEPMLEYSKLDPKEISVKF